MEESIKFYKEIVGLPINRRFAAGPGSEICFLGEGETKIELVYDPNHKAAKDVQGISIGFEVESLDEMIKNIKEKGLELDGGVFQPNPHVKLFM
jgi:lactoylglutathione lyase